MVVLDWPECGSVESVPGERGGAERCVCGRVAGKGLVLLEVARGELFEFGEDRGGDLAGGGFGVVVGLGEDVGGDFDDDRAAVVQAV